MLGKFDAAIVVFKATVGMKAFVINLSNKY